MGLLARTSRKRAGFSLDFQLIGHRKEGKINKSKKVGKFVFWNIAGLDRKDREFWDYIESFDFIGLSETWIEEHNWVKIKSRLSQNFIWVHQAAKRENKKGRAKGGILTGVRKNWSTEEVKDKEIEGIVERKMKIDGRKWRVLTIYNGGEMKQMSKHIQELIKEEEEEMLVIGGDFNARIGTEGETYVGEEEDEEDRKRKRKSKDTKKNTDGSHLLKMTEDRGWHIANGQTEGDEQGEFTYIGSRGATVIDFILTNTQSRAEIKRLEIGERTEADHQPLCMQIEVTQEKTREGKEEEKEKEVICWKKESIQEYMESTKEILFQAEDLNEKWTELKKVIHEKMIKRKSKTRKWKIGHKFWWDKECSKVKRKVKALYKHWKEGKGTKKDYLKERRVFKVLCKEKETIKREQELKEIKEAKTDAKIWEYINKDRKRRVAIGENITPEEWRGHFMKTLGGTSRRQLGERRNLDQDEESELTNEEILKQIEKMKKKKATGEDKIPSEAWIHCGVNTRKRLIDLIKSIWKGEGFPVDWRKGVITPVHKKGDLEKVENYRGITLLDTAYKIYAAVLNERLRKEIREKNILPESQAGFRENRGTIDNAYTLHHVVERELSHKKGKVYAFFMDLKSAFDKVDRGLLWKAMSRGGIRRGLVERTKEIYEETINVAKCKNQCSEEFWTSEGIRQGCPLSPTLFTVFTADMEKVLRNGQAGGLVVGKEKFWSLAYADDVVLVANKEEEMRDMIKRTERYLDRKKLTLNVEKSKLMIFSKKGGRSRKIVWEWKGRGIETVKKFNYLGVTFQKNGDITEHVRERAKRANVLIRQVWGIGERKFKDDYRRRIWIYKTLVMSVMNYGAEIYGWKERSELEKVQLKYIRWTLGLDNCTPCYIILEETKMDKVRVGTGIRALKFEERLRKAEGRNLVKACLQEKEKGVCKTRNIEERKQYLERNGYSQVGLDQLLENNLEIIGKFRSRDREVQKQRQWNSIDAARYNPMYKYIVSSTIPRYLSQAGRGDSQKIIARMRCGNMEEVNRYWLVEEKRNCLLCKIETGTFKHLLEECIMIDRSEIRLHEIYEDTEKENIIKWLRQIDKKKKSSIG